MKRILVVEDNSPQRRMIVRLLTSKGHSIRIARDGEEALQRMHEHVPDLVLLDLLMPVCDGWAVRRRMLEDPALRHVPVIIITGVDVPMAGWEILRVDGALRKPFDKDDLLSMLEYVFLEAA